MVLSFKSNPEGEKKAGPTVEKRRSPRYDLGENFPFKTKLILFQNGGVKTTDAKGKEWSATLIDLSATGANLHLSLAAVAFQREACRLKITRGDYLLEIPATIAHFRCHSQYSQCGLSFNFPNLESQQAYLQLLEPIVIGNSLIPIEAVQDTPGRHREQFGNGTSTALSVWRSAPGGEITGFDLRMNRYVVRWNEGAPELEVAGLGEIDPSKPNPPVPVLVPLTEAQHEDFRWIFCLAVPNLSPSVPVDVRKFLASLVA